MMELCFLYVMIILFLLYFPFFRECLTAPDVILYQELYLVCLDVAGRHVCYPPYLTEHAFTFQALSIYMYDKYICSVFSLLFVTGRSTHTDQSESMKPDCLLRLSLGGMTLTLLEQEPAQDPEDLSSMAKVSQLFFHELAFFKDSMFSERDFENLRGNFAKACPHSHLRYTAVLFLHFTISSLSMR